MNDTTRRTAVTQLRRLLRRIDRSHTNDPSGCPTCSLQQLSAQLIEELEGEAQQFNNPDIPPGAASVLLATEAVLGLVYLLDIREADEQGRVVQALLDHVGGMVLDILAQDEMTAQQIIEYTEGEGGGAPPTGGGRRGGGSLH